LLVRARMALTELWSFPWRVAKHCEKDTRAHQEAFGHTARS